MLQTLYGSLIQAFTVKCDAALMTEGSVQLQSCLSGLSKCIIQHVLPRPTLIKLTAPDSLREPELPEVNTLEMTQHGSATPI